MRVVHLLRKPLSEGTVASNTLKHGCGGLNIDGTRIAHDTGVDLGAVQRQRSTPGVDFGGARVGDVLPMYKPGGRWPANMVVQHLDGCRQVGTVQEASYRIFRWKDGMKAFGNAAGHEYEQTEVQGGVVPVWACVSGCPAVALDEQGGSTTSKRSMRGVGWSDSEVFGVGDPGFDTKRGYDDEGGVSRFYKQIGGNHEGTP